MIVCLITLFSCSSLKVNDIYYNNHGMFDEIISFNNLDSTFQIVKVGDLLNDTLNGKFEVRKRRVLMHVSQKKKVTIIKKDKNLSGLKLRIFDDYGDLLCSVEIANTDKHFSKKSSSFSLVRINEKEFKVEYLDCNEMFEIAEQDFSYDIILRQRQNSYDNFLLIGKLMNNGNMIKIDNKIFGSTHE